MPNYKIILNWSIFSLFPTRIMMLTEELQAIDLKKHSVIAMEQ